MQSIYLDHNATTPPRPEVIEVMARLQAAGHGNPASGHRPGQKAHRLLEEARHGMAQILGANLEGTSPDRLILTSGGSEANNLALLGLARGSRKIIDPCIANDPGRSPVPWRDPLESRISYGRINKHRQPYSTPYHALLSYSASSRLCVRIFLRSGCGSAAP